MAEGVGEVTDCDTQGTSNCCGECTQRSLTLQMYTDTKGGTPVTRCSDSMTIKMSPKKHITTFLKSSQEGVTLQTHFKVYKND